MLIFNFNFKTFQSNQCLWLDATPRLKSALYTHLNIVINMNCETNKIRSSIFEQSINDKCQDHVSITSGFSPQLQAYFRSCHARITQQAKVEKNQLIFGLKENSTLNKSVTPDKLKLANSNSNNNNRRFRKCYNYRKTANYKSCMRKYYKCYQFSKDLTKLRNCRKKFNIKPLPIRRVHSSKNEFFK